MKRTLNPNFCGRFLLLFLGLLMTDTMVMAQDKDKQGDELRVNFEKGYDEEAGLWTIWFFTSVDGAVVHYSLNGGATAEYGGETVLTMRVGDTISYYATAEGYEPTGTVTKTAGQYIWHLMESWYEWFYSDGEKTIAKGDETTGGFCQMVVDGSLLSEHLTAGSSNWDAAFRVASEGGIVGDADCTYAISDLTEGQYLRVFVEAGDKTGLGVTALEGLEYDDWNSEYEAGEAWRMLMFRVTAAGTAKFKVEGGVRLTDVVLLDESTPEMPWFSLLQGEGTGRTYRIWMPQGGTTLYYTDGLASEVPPVGSPLYSHTSQHSADVAVSGDGLLAAYATNRKGTSEIAVKQVSDAAFTLKSPTISHTWDASAGMWIINLYSNQSGVEGWPNATIYYSIDGGEETAYEGQFSMAVGQTVTCYAAANGYISSPVMTATAKDPQEALRWVWSYYVYASENVITLGNEVESGLYQLTVNGSVIGGGHLLTPNENINDNFKLTYSGIYSAEKRTYAVADLKEGQYLYLFHTYSKPANITPLQGATVDAWSSGLNFTVLQVTAGGTVRFTIDGGVYLSQLSLYEVPQSGEVVVADGNGNQLSYYYEDATAPAVFTGIYSYAEDETKAGHIVIADCVTDKNGRTHEVSYVAGYLNNRSKLKSVVFGQNIRGTGGSDGTGSNAFYNCQQLESVTLNSRLQTLNSSTFNYCRSLQTIDLSRAAGLTGIADYCFSYAGISDIGIPASVRELGPGCFYQCTALQNVSFDENSQLTDIPNNCFYQCTALERLTLPNSVRTVGSQAFYNCYALTEIGFGTGLADGGFYNNYTLFYNCSNMEKMTIPGANFPFTANYSSLPNSMKLYVRPDMVDVYLESDYTRRFHIMAIGAQTSFAVTTTAASRLDTELARLTDTPEDVVELTVSGPINGTDINYIHQRMPMIEVLNLLNARIVEGGENYNRWSVGSGGVSRYGSTSYATSTDSVGSYMFWNLPALKRLVLPGTVTGVADFVADCCYKLQELVLPEGLKHIGIRAFSMNSSNNKLSRLNIPSTVVYIGDYAFCQTNIEGVTIPEGVKRIENSTFCYCQKLREVTLHDGITSIGERAFYECEELTAISLPAQLTAIGDNAFGYCHELSSPLVIPATCTTIGYGAFQYDERVPSVTFNEGLQSIGHAAFANCMRMGDVRLPQSLTTLGEQSFCNVDSLRSFVFPANIKEVPERVLSACDSLRSVTLAEGTTKIGYYAFASCPALKEMNLNQPTLTQIGSQAFAYTGFANVTIPDQVTELGSGAFQECKLLKSINMPAGITTVPDNICYNCPELATVGMHDGITAIGYRAFCNCTALTGIDLNDGITSIGSEAFGNCFSLAIDKLPAQLTTISSYAFCNTKAMTAHIVLPAGLKTLGYEAFRSSGITGVTLPEGITSFNNEVFYGCESLATVNLPADLTVLPNYTFAYTTALKEITLPEGLTSIGNNAFYYSGLSEVVLPLSLTSIGSYAFSGTQLEEIVVPKNVTTVGNLFAAYCPKLKTAKLGRKQNYSNNRYFDYFAESNSLELLRVYAGTPPSISSYNAAYRTHCVLEVPDGVAGVYRETDCWKEFKEIRVFESDDMLNSLDYAVMKEIYRQLDGANWANAWDVSNQSHANGKWKGVTTEADSEDGELFYITAIDLSGQGLRGQLPRSVFTLPRLTSLNLSNNQIEAMVDTLLTTENNRLTTVNLMGNHFTGDLYPFASKLTAMTSLDVSYNRLTGISQALSHEKLSNGNFYRGFQFIDYATKEVVVPEEMTGDVVIDMTPGQPIELPVNNFQVYRHEYGDFNLSFSSLYRMYKSGSGLTYGNTELAKQSDGLWDVYKGYSNYVLRAPKGVPVAYTHGQPYYSCITYIMRFDWQDGDVNGDQTVDVGDLQNVIYYALCERKPNEDLFNFSAADANSDNVINVSDIIGNVESILSYNPATPASGSRARISYKVYGDGQNLLSAETGNLVLKNTDEVGALQLTVGGATLADIHVNNAVASRFRVNMRQTAQGVRVVVYSPAMHTMAPGEHRLLEALPAGAQVTDAQLVDSEARHLGVAIDGVVTSIDQTADLLPADALFYDLGGRRVGPWESLPAGVYVARVNGKQMKVKK